MKLCQLTPSENRPTIAAGHPERDPPRGFACAQAVSDRLPLVDRSFDCILLSAVIEHLESPQLTIREAARVLRPGGRVLVTTQLLVGSGLSIQYCGTIYALSPFLTLASRKWADRRLAGEIDTALTEEHIERGTGRRPVGFPRGAVSA
jgi:SAM-dependent methyltransferase